VIEDALNAPLLFFLFFRADIRSRCINYDCGGKADFDWMGWACSRRTKGIYQKLQHLFPKT